MKRSRIVQIDMTLINRDTAQKILSDKSVAFGSDEERPLKEFKDLSRKSN